MLSGRNWLDFPPKCTWPYVPEGSILHSHCCEDLKSYVLECFFSYVFDAVVVKCICHSLITRHKQDNSVALVPPKFCSSGTYSVYVSWLLILDSKRGDCSCHYRQEQSPQKEVIVLACNGCLGLWSYAFCLVQAVPFCTRITLPTMLSRRYYENVESLASHLDGPSFKGSFHVQQGKEIAIFRIWIRMDFSVNKM